MQDTIYQIIMSLNGEIYSPELSREQLSDHDAILQDVVDGQFAGDFVAMFQSERDAAGKIHTWDITAEVRAAMEGEEVMNREDPNAEHRIGCFEAGVGRWSS